MGQVDVRVRETLRNARSWEPASDDMTRIMAAKGALKELTSSSPADAALTSLRGLLPFAAGMIDVLSIARPSEPANFVYSVPEEFLVTRAQLIHNDPAIPLATTLPDRLALRGTDAMPDGAFESDPYNQVMYNRFGFNNVTGMILSPRHLCSTEPVTVLFLFAGSGVRIPTWEECRRLELVCHDLYEAMERVKLPFIPHQPLQFQLLQEQDLGYVLLRPDGACREVNQRALLLAKKYGFAGSGTWRGRVEELTRGIRVMAQGASYVKQRVRCADGSGVLEMSLHKLAKKHYAMGEDSMFIEMREFLSENSVKLGKGPLDVLSLRQRQIADLLVDSGHSYKQIAQQLQVSEGTIRTHCERIYRKMGVHSRAELVELVRRSAC